MNPFVNLSKRSVSLPSGCKDLVDVLHQPKTKHEIAIRRFLSLVLFQAQQDRATELIIGPSKGEDTPIRYKVDGTWYEMSPFPSHMRAVVVSEAARFAHMPGGAYPQEGDMAIAFGEFQLKWKVVIKSADGDCVFTLT